jgi:phosphopantothenoylcysteine decarboxylase/phosphopantothenate--cysteine ligase
VLVTAGPTREPIDAVRTLTNRSSGKMGYALAQAAVRRGAETTLVSGPTSLEPPWGAELVRVETAAQMALAVDAHLGRCDILLMAAAVADFAVRRPGRGKLKKAGGPPRLELVPTRDILKSVAGRRRRPLLVGFAAEHGDPLPEAGRKLREKKLALVVANDISRRDAGFDADTNRVTLVDAAGAQPLPLQPKAQVAEAILDRVEKLLGKKRRGTV